MDKPTGSKDVIASAVLEFAKRWDSELRRAAERMHCDCPNQIRIESEHDPRCPVHVLLRSGRLMVEEANDALGDEE